MSVSKLTSLRIKLLLPEGWNFFTRDPREERVFIYKTNANSEFTAIEEWPNNAYRNMFGIKRNARAIGTDYGMILSKISDSNWIKIDEKDLSVFFQRTKNLEPQFFFNYPDDAKEEARHFLYGDLVFVKKQIIPWSWYRMNLNNSSAIKVLYGVVGKKK